MQREWRCRRNFDVIGRKRRLECRRTLRLGEVRLLALSIDIVHAEAASIVLNAMSRNTTPTSTNPSFMKLLFSEDI